MQINIPKLEKKMKARKMSKRALAKKANIARQTLYNIFNNPKNLNHLEAISAALDTNPKLLLE